MSRKSNAIPTLFALLIVMLLAVMAIGFSWYRFINTPFTRNTTLYIQKGSSLKHISTVMAQNYLIAHPRYFEILGRIQGLSHQLKAGEYQIKKGMTPAQLMSHMAAGLVMSHDFTIIEGWTFDTLKKALLANKDLKPNIKNLSNQAIMQKLGDPSQKPEGLFFPDTYQYHWGETDLTILKRAFNKMHEVIATQWAARAEHLPYKNSYAALTMASLIEKETANDGERERIAGVLIRRLTTVMHLGVDPSVVYGLHEPYGYRLTRRDLRKKTPYNTYLKYGLPPTPIAMPGLASIIAALHPDHGKALYYVSRNDGTHQFSDTYAEHLRAVNKWQRSKNKKEKT